jgi:hypothetical protein
MAKVLIEGLANQSLFQTGLKRGQNTGLQPAQLHRAAHQTHKTKEHPHGTSR